MTVQLANFMVFAYGGVRDRRPHRHKVYQRRGGGPYATVITNAAGETIARVAFDPGVDEAEAEVLSARVISWLNVEARRRVLSDMEVRLRLGEQTVHKRRA